MKLGEIAFHVESFFEWVSSAFELLYHGYWRELTLGQFFFVLMVILTYVHLFISLFRWVFNLKVSMELVSSLVVLKSLLLMIILNWP